MAQADFGTKRVCPETGRKFYDLGKDPIVSPYTGKTYPVAFFEEVATNLIKAKAKAKPAAVDDEDEDEIDEVEKDDTLISLEDADDAVDTDDAALPDLGDNTDDEVIDDGDDDDTFLAPDEDDEDDDDVSGIVAIGGDDED